MNKWQPIVGFFTAVVMTSLLSCLAMVLWRHTHSTSEGLSYSDQWLHERLNLSAEQHRQLEAIEQRFTTASKQIRKELQSLNTQLGQALLEENHYSERIDLIIERIHRQQSALQKLVINHLYEMQASLSAEQCAQLKKMAADVLSDPLP